MSLLIKYKKVIRISIGLLIIPLIFMQLAAHVNAASASCYSETAGTNGITTLTESACPATGKDSSGTTFTLGTSDCYFVETKSVPAASPNDDTYVQSTVYEQQDCSTLQCQGGSSNIPANINCSPTDPCDLPANSGSALCSGVVKNYIDPVILFVGGGVGLVIVIMIVIGGIQFITSGGDPNHVAEAKKRIANALLALVAWILIYAFLNWIMPGGVFK
jgi:hypothetical protein